MIEIWLNGELKQIESNSNLIDIAGLLGLNDGAYAVAVNEQFVPKSDYQTKPINKHDKIELLMPMQGG